MGEVMEWAQNHALGIGCIFSLGKAPAPDCSLCGSGPFTCDGLFLLLPMYLPGPALTTL